MSNILSVVPRTFRKYAKGKVLSQISLRYRTHFGLKLRLVGQQPSTVLTLWGHHVVKALHNHLDALSHAHTHTYTHSVIELRKTVWNISLNCLFLICSLII